MRGFDAESVIELYQKYRDPLARVRDDQREFCRANQATMTPQLDDLEAEITYLLLREYRPATVVEIGTFHGWSTTWLLSALRDNGTGSLYSFDIKDNVVANVPDELAEERWTFTKGDIRHNLDALPEGVDHLFLDAAHNGWFARWYLTHLFPKVAEGTPVSVHDVFHGRRALPFTEGAAVLGWLARRGAGYFTASAAKDPTVHRELLLAKERLELADPVRSGRRNPMIFFPMPR
ncbi:class I SAM-dependent methyltransferase [Allosalinactinospora lopnorensis]|uniref:class I SAM-dependent methyltransferase n=1 Tax=Allosalinactinospora lopnorensis TaxID=1352348 RepID=UPI000623FACA|nr:class I SAM-dependent methyltransferase [Allosalinactinospora lopnorensis]